MAATYNVKLERREAGEVVEVKHLYVSASDDKAGYAKARRRAEARMAKQGRKGSRAVTANCVG